MIVTQPLDLMKAISREQLSDSRDMAMGFVHSFRLESVLESTEKQQLQTDNYNCQISQIFLFLHEEPQEVIVLHGIWRHIKEFGMEGQFPRISSPAKLEKRC